MARVKKFQVLTRPLAKTRPLMGQLDMPRDDRDEALGYYLQMRVRQLIEQGRSQTWIAERAGVSQPAVSQLLSSRMAGFGMLFALSKVLNQTPGQILDDALDWWTNRGGRIQALEQLAQDADEHRAELERLRAESKATKKKSAGGKR